MKESSEIIGFLLDHIMDSLISDKKYGRQLFVMMVSDNGRARLLLLHHIIAKQTESLQKVLPELRRYSELVISDLAGKRGPICLASYFALAVLSKPLGFLSLVKYGLQDVCHFILENCMERMGFADTWKGAILSPEGRLELILMTTKMVANGYEHFRWVPQFLLSQHLVFTPSACGYDLTPQNWSQLELKVLDDILKEFFSEMPTNSLLSLFIAPSMSSIIVKHIFRVIISRPNGFVDLCKSCLFSQDELIELVQGFADDLQFSTAFMMQFLNGSIDPSLEPRIEHGFTI